MQAIAHLVETGALRAHIEATFPLAEAAKAHALGETGRTTGKIVLTVREETGKAQLALRLMQDLFTQQPPGTWAIAYSLVGASVWSTQEIVYPKHPLTHFSLTLLGGILAGVVLTIHGWLYPLIHGHASGVGAAGGELTVYLASALYSALLAPLFLGVLHRMRKAFAFARSRA